MVARSLQRRMAKLQRLRGSYQLRVGPSEALLGLLANLDTMTSAERSALREWVSGHQANSREPWGPNWGPIRQCGGI